MMLSIFGGNGLKSGKADPLPFNKIADEILWCYKTSSVAVSQGAQGQARCVGCSH